MVHSNEPVPVFPPVDFLVHNRLNLFFLPYARRALIDITGGYKPERELWSYLCAQSAWKMNWDCSLLKTTGAWRSFCAQRAAGVSDGAQGDNVGILQGLQVLRWSDCEIGTGVSEGSKCKHAQRKWVTIPTLVLAHCGSPRILEADAKSWPLCAFGSLCEQTNVTMTVFGWILLWPTRLKGLDAGSACLRLRLGLSLGSQYQADVHHCVLRWKRIPRAQCVLQGKESRRMERSYSYCLLNCQHVVKEGSRAHVKVGREKGWAT